MLWRKSQERETILHRTIPSRGFMDKECFDNIETDRNLMVPWFLMSCFAISENAPILSPEMHDRLSVRLHRESDDITHPHSGLLNYQDVREGIHSGEYPKKLELTLNAIRRSFGKQNTTG